MKFFNNNLDICALIIYFCFVPIYMTNDYKNHKKYLILVLLFYGDNVCLGVCVAVFMRIDTFKKLFLI